VPGKNLGKGALGSSRARRENHLLEEETVKIGREDSDIPYSLHLNDRKGEGLYDSRKRGHARKEGGRE